MLKNKFPKDRGHFWSLLKYSLPRLLVLHSSVFSCSSAACTPTLLWCENEEIELQCELRLGLAQDSRLIKVQQATGWGCPCGEKCWLKLELPAKVADLEAGTETAVQCGQDERSESRMRWSEQAGTDPYEKKQPWTILTAVVTDCKVCEATGPRKCHKDEWMATHILLYTVVPY